MHPHIPEEELHAYCDEQLSSSQRREIAAHLLGCLICRAQHGEVVDLRARASALLELAVPHGAPRTATVRRGLRIPLLGRRASIAAAVIALIGGGVWISRQSRAQQNDSRQLSAAFVTPSLLDPFTDIDSDSGAVQPKPAAVERRMLTLGSGSAIRPQVVFSALTPASRRPNLTESTAEVDPVEAAGWDQVTWDSALVESNGSLARLDGLPVKAVRLHRSDDGGRPTFVVRQQLADGRPVWVVEGPVEDVGPVNHVFEASNVGMSMPLRTHPDYVKIGGSQMQSIRMVTVAAYLAPDSLDALTAKLRRR